MSSTPPTDSFLSSLVNLKGSEAGAPRDPTPLSPQGVFQSLSLGIVSPAAGIKGCVKEPGY
jgi:hypothetical protein